MKARFVIQVGTTTPPFFLHVGGRRLVQHPIAARWFVSHEAADNVLRREQSHRPSCVRQLTEDCLRVRL